MAQTDSLEADYAATHAARDNQGLQNFITNTGSWGAAPAATDNVAPKVPTPAPPGAPQDKPYFPEGDSRNAPAALTVAPAPAIPKRSWLGDMARGFSTFPTDVLTGVAKAGENAVNAGIDLGNYLQQKFPLGGLDIEKDGIHFVPPGQQMPPLKDVNVVDGIAPAADSHTGQVTRSISQFVAGFIPASRALEAAGVAGKLANGLSAGAISDFLTTAPDQGRLSDLWAQAGLPKNLLTETLKSDPSDPALIGRLKNAAEGTAIGAAAEGLLAGVRTIAAMRHAARESGLVIDPATGVPGVKASALNMGDPKDHTFRYHDDASPGGRTGPRDFAAEGDVGVPGDVAARGLLHGEHILQDVYINFARMETPEAVQKVMRQVADGYAANIDEASRGVVSHGDTLALANDMGMTVDDLLGRRAANGVATPYLAHEAVAARQMLDASGRALMDFAERAADPNAGLIDHYRFRKALGIHNAIQTEVLAARTETARSLNSWNIKVGSDADRLNAVRAMIDRSGGEATSQDIARRLAILKKSGAADVRNITNLANRGVFAQTADAVKQAFVSSLLTSPVTQEANFFSNFATLAQQIQERAATRVLAPEEVAAGEPLAMAHGALMGFKDSLRLGYRAYRTGETGGWIGKIDSPQDAISASAFGQVGTPVGRAIDMVGQAVNIPGRLLLGADEFFKSLNYRAELQAQAVRQASSEGLDAAAFKARVTDLANNPPSAAQTVATDAALYSTFTNDPGAFVNKLIQLRNGDGNPLINAGMLMTLPFIRTPANILRYSLERSPLAPLVSKWRDDIAAGGARAAVAQARMATGTMVWSTAMDGAYRGQISGRGPQNAGERNALEGTGWRPYSVKIGNNWISYNRIDPIGMSLATAADLGEVLKQSDVHPEDFDNVMNVMAAGIGAVSDAAINKSYLSGLSQLTQMLTDPRGYSSRYMQSFLSSMVPAGPLLGRVEAAVDPTARNPMTPFQYVQSRIPGLSSSLLPRRDIWGQPIRPNDALGDTYDAFSALPASTVVNSPADRELLKQGVYPPKLNMRANIHGADINLRDFPSAYDAIARLTGNDWKNPVTGKGLKDRITDLATNTGPEASLYSRLGDGPDGLRGAYLKRVFATHREAAIDQVMRDPQFSDLQAAVRAGIAEKNTARLKALH
jgi:hypothetical protein